MPTLYNNHNMTVEELENENYRLYFGKDLDVYFNAGVCQHAAECVRGNHAVFNTQQKPWIKVDEAPSSEVMAIINRCPSGALKYIEK